MDYQNKTLTPKVKNIILNNILVDNSNYAWWLRGLPEQSFENIYFNNITITNTQKEYIYRVNRNNPAPLVLNFEWQLQQVTETLNVIKDKNSDYFLSFSEWVYFLRLDMNSPRYNRSKFRIGVPGYFCPPCMHVNTRQVFVLTRR